MQLSLLILAMLMLLAASAPIIIEALEVVVWSADLELYRTIALIFASFLLGILAFVRPLARDDVNTSELKEEHEQLTVKLENLQRDNVTLEAHAEKLELAHNDASQQLERVRAEAKSKLHQVTDQEVIHFLSLLQNRGRFVDFLMDDVTQYSDSQIGAAARVVHQGCRTVVRDYFDIQPISDQNEGATLTLDSNYDARRFRILGAGAGDPPYRGRLLHRGWFTKSVNLPEPVDALMAAEGKGVIAPAEVELH